MAGKAGFQTKTLSRTDVPALSIERYPSLAAEEDHFEQQQTGWMIVAAQFDAVVDIVPDSSLIVEIVSELESCARANVSILPHPPTRPRTCSKPRRVNSRDLAISTACRHLNLS
jgi:hypothetical protein